MNVVLGVTALGLITTRQIPLSIILFVVLMVELDIIIACKFKNNIKKAILYMIAFMQIVVSMFTTLVFIR